MEEVTDLKQFHLYNDKGKITGVFDFAIFEYIKKHCKLFVMGGTPFLYQDGYYRADESGALLKTMIRKLIYPNFVKSTTIKRIYELFLSDIELEKKFSEINQYPAHWINFKNGFYDPKKQKMIAHDPKYLAINIIPHCYGSAQNSAGEKIETWLSFVCPEDDAREMLLQFTGYCMTRDVSVQRFLVLCGLGGSGKSTLIRMIEAIIGTENISNISLMDLQTRFASYGLMAKLLNSCADLEITALEDTSTLKKCLGEDSLRGEQKGHDAISFHSYAKLLFSTNELPIVKAEKTNGFFRRLLIHGMDDMPKQKNANLFNELNEEIDYFIKLAVEALIRMYRNGDITESEASKRAVAQLRCDSDTVQAFLSEETAEVRGSRIDRVILWDKYSKYCDDNDRQTLTKNNFFKSLRSKGFAEVKSNGIRYFQGISFEKNAEKVPLNNEKSALNRFLPVDCMGESELPFE